MIGKPLLGVVGLLAAAGATLARPAPPTVDFGHDVRPVLAAQCFACHGADPAARKANLRLDRPIDAAQARAVALRIEGQTMPPAGSGHTLKPGERATLLRWARAGAPFAEHWAFVKPDRTRALASLGRGAGTNTLDAFVRAKLREKGLAPSPEADRRTLIRRVSLDLTGLPPTSAEVEAFVADRKPGAYERVVDRLLASPRYGEHWARLWMDLGRYADTKGYEKDQPRTIWRWRDWLIDAFNADMPYDRFTRELLAGDLLPGATSDQILATAFHRNTMTNDEGGTDDEEFRQVAVKDRVDTTVQVWMGLTMGCAKCHTHKYDPITQTDYYRFYALFNQTEDADRYDDGPSALSPTAEQAARLANLDDKVKALDEAFWRPQSERAAEQRAWEDELARARLWSVAAARPLSTASGATLTARPDGALLASGPRKTTDSYTLDVPLPESTVTALRLEVLKDPGLPGGGPGRDRNDQNAVVSEVRVVHIAADGRRIPVTLVRPRADFEQGGWPAANTIDGKPDTGWAWAPRNAEPHVLLFDLKTPVTGGRLEVVLEQNYPNLPVGCLRLSVSGSDPARLAAELRTDAERAATPAAQRTGDDQRRLDRAFRETHEPTKGISGQLAAAVGERDTLRGQIPRTPILRELPTDRQRITRLHRRGNFLDPGETLTPALLPAFGPLPAGAPLNRLGAAQWLTGKDNPLTARVAVNRIWARLFGVGLVETEEDFGLQGASPTHPELLDWLAVAYRDDWGWSQKKLLKAIVLSATYRQSSRVDPLKERADPRNRWLSRGPRFRLPAEVIRDQALAASGLLSAKLYGPSVMPPQPDGLWRTTYSSLRWETSPGEDRWRRALYTFLRRTSPYPALTTFDSGSGEVCLVRRVRTNTPLQALVTLNDPAFVEAAAALGRAMLRGGIDEGFRRLLARPASAAERARVTALFHSVLADFRRDPKAADALLATANVRPTRDDDPGLLAAWTVVGNVLLNLDEAVTKQ